MDEWMPGSIIWTMRPRAPSHSAVRRPCEIGDWPAYYINNVETLISSMRMPQLKMEGKNMVVVDRVLLLGVFSGMLDAEQGANY